MMIEKSALQNKTIKLLEFDAIREKLASHAMSEEVAAIIRGEIPLSDPGEVVKTKTAVQAIIVRINEGETDPRRYLPSIGFLLPRLDIEGIVLDPDETCAIGLFCERGEELQQWLSAAAGGYAVFAEMLTDTPDCATATADVAASAVAIATAVFRVMDRDGVIRDLPELRAIKKRIQNLNAELESAVSRYTATEDVRRMLQSVVPSQRDGRTVLAVKANFRGRIRGIVHEVSSSGQTVFIEPENVVEKNNELLVEQRNLDAEIRKILMNVTGTIAEHSGALKIFHQKVLSMEVLMAKARYSLDTDGCFSADEGPFIEGAFNEGASKLVFVRARHPLLQNAVPINLTMDSGTSALIITGPNTGGKTVALKTVGLFALMNQIGLALPAAQGTSLPIFDGVFADIGDEQSIGQSLSTFSAHITNIADIITHSSSHSLILLDELGSGTDPQEGSAIAMAILDRLIEKNARLIITTHHSILKNYGYSRQAVENASVEFDPRTLSPTYRIITGIPGESRALEIAERNGLPRKIVAQAKNYLDSGHSDVSALIIGLKEKHRELDNLTEKAKSEDIRLMDERRKADLKELRLRQKEAELKAGFTGKLRLLLDESRKTLENLVREVREGEITREKTARVKGFLGDLARTVEAEEAALAEEEREIAEKRRHVEARGAKSATAAEFSPGMEVFAGEAKRRGVLIRPDKKSPTGNTWIVETGSIKVSFPESELIPASHGSEGDAAPLPRVAAVSINDIVSAVKPEIDLRGMRLEEAIDSLRRQLDAALLRGLSTFSVVHGKGDGILQKGVHEWLKHEPTVADYYFSRPEQGGFGRTEVVLKG